MKYCSEDRYLGFENIKDEYYDRKVNLKNYFMTKPVKKLQTSRTI